MITMPIIDGIRSRYEKGDTITSIAREFGLDRKTVRKYIRMDDFSPVLPVKKQTASILDPFVPAIQEWLEEDRQVWRKQRHTAKRIWERLRDEKGFTGSYQTVQRYVKRYREEKLIESEANGKNGYLQLDWEPGCAQADFGEADFLMGGSLQRLKYLVVTFPYSNTGYVQVFGGETAECVCQGLLDVFGQIGGVPHRIIFDNATGIGRRVGTEIREADLFRKFRNHYGFEAVFCNPYSGHEKGNCEKFVQTVRQHLFVPVPAVTDLCEYNRYLFAKVPDLHAHMHYRKERPQPELFQEDLKVLRSLPRHPFEAGKYLHRKTDRYGRILLDGRHYYSTRPELQQVNVLVSVGAHTVIILSEQGKVPAEHTRRFGKDRTESMDPASSLALLRKNIGAWDQCSIRKHLADPLREYLDRAQKEDRRQSIRILDQLTRRFGFETAAEAMNLTAQRGSVNHDDAFVLAGRIRDGGLNMQPDPGPSLELYDRFFIPGGSRS